MINQSIIVGRILNTPTMTTINEKSICNLTIVVPRNYKNSDGIYESDYIDCTVWNGIAQNVTEYCQKGDIVGIKGRLSKLKNEDKLTLIAEKVTFLSSKKGETTNEEV